jgi:predicted nucleic acid-binding protein
VPQLSILFSRVLVPKAVREDLFKRRLTKDRLQFLFDIYAFIERCDDYEKGAVEILLAERARRGMRDRAEVEAVVQASEFGAAVLVDDRWGRKLASRYDLDHHGTFWVLQRFYELRLMSASALRIGFATLRNRGTRLPWKAVDELLLQIGEAAL